MIEAGIDVNRQDVYGCTAFHRSAERGTTEVADLLVKAKADLNVRDNNDDTPMSWARKSENREILEEVLRENGKKASYNIIEDDLDALLDAAGEGNIEKVQDFIKFMDINGKNRESYTEDTALIRASSAGKGFCSFQYLIDFLIVKFNMVFNRFFIHN